MESADGVTHGRALETHPNGDTRGHMRETYGEITVMLGTELHIWVGFLDGALTITGGRRPTELGLDLAHNCHRGTSRGWEGSMCCNPTEKSLGAPCAVEHQLGE